MIPPTTGQGHRLDCACSLGQTVCRDRDAPYLQHACLGRCSALAAQMLVAQAVVQQTVCLYGPHGPFGFFCWQQIVAAYELTPDSQRAVDWGPTPLLAPPEQHPMSAFQNAISKIFAIAVQLPVCRW